MTQPQRFDIFMIGVGGQGIGLLSEALLRAADAAGLPARGVDTHGLAQRGGTVTSHLRIGDGAHSPLVPAGQAHLVIALERHEALRGLTTQVADGGTLVYFDSEWQPLPVRIGKVPRFDPAVIAEEAKARRVTCHKVADEVCAKDASSPKSATDGTPSKGIPDPRMQNVAVIAAILREKLIPGLEKKHVVQALGDLMSGKLLEKNLDLLNRLAP